jgi:hypothetical protein
LFFHADSILIDSLAVFRIVLKKFYPAMMRPPMTRYPEPKRSIVLTSGDLQREGEGSAPLLLRATLIHVAQDFCLCQKAKNE